MRSILIAFVVVASSLLGSEARSQSWSGSLPAVQGAVGSLVFELPAVVGLDAWEARIAYSAEVFESLLPDAFGSTHPFVFDADRVGRPGEPDAASFPGISVADALLLQSKNAQNAFKYEQVNVIMMNWITGPQVFPLDHAGGALFQAQFQVKSDAVIGPTTVFTHFIYGGSIGEEIELAQPLRLSADIVPIPEPDTWAMIVAGLAAVGAAVMRARRIRSRTVASTLSVH